MSKAPAKTNAMRALEQKKIAYEARLYEVDESDLSAETVAAKVGLPPSQVYKTLLVRGEKRGPLFAVIAGDQELDLKALAKVAGEKRVDTVPLKEVTPLTGYIRGGVTALAAKKDFPVFLDESALAAPVISISAGVRGCQLFLAPEAYKAATGATVGAFQRPKTE